MFEKRPKYTLRKLTVGLSSVMIGSIVLWTNAPKAHADSVDGTENTSSIVQPTSKDDDQGTSSAQPENSSEQNGVDPVSSTEENNVDSDSVSEDTTQNGKTQNAVTTSENTDKSESKPAASTSSAKETTPTAPDNSASTVVSNNKDDLDKNWVDLNNGKAQVYFTVKGKDQKTYVTSYVNDNKKMVESTLYTNNIDPNSLELHIEYQNGDKAANPGVILTWGIDTLQIDTDRIGTAGLVYTLNSGVQDDVPVSPGAGIYGTYNEWLNKGQDLSKLTALSIWKNVPANSSFSAVLPFKFVGDSASKKATSVWMNTPSSSARINLVFDPTDTNLEPQKIDPPQKPTTEDATATTGIYNNPNVTNSDWLKMVHGEAIAYYTATGKDGKTYVTGYVAANGKSESIINVDQIDPNTLEYHLLYQSKDGEVGSGLWANFADGKSVVVDQSRVGTDGLQLKSEQGNKYSWQVNGVGDGGNYYDYAGYLKTHNNSLDKLTNLSITGTRIKAGDTIEITIPVKYVGQLSNTVRSIAFNPIIDDYGNGFTRNSANLYFTTVVKDLSQVKQIILSPGEFLGEQPGQSNWKYLEEIAPDMPNGFDVFKISNFPTYKGAFNMDSLPTGDLPKVIYGTAQYFIDLTEIQEIFAKHGYTVKYLNNNGQAQEMPFYAYSTLPSATFTDHESGSDPSIIDIQVQAVPAIILNTDQHYVADPNAKPWDITSMVDAIYAADDTGARKSRDQLDQLAKTDVDITYTYQAVGDSNVVATNKVDLTKAGIYTVTYSHTYADGRVVKDSRKVYVDPVPEMEIKQVTRTINYVEEGNESNVLHSSTIQTVTLNRNKKVNVETGEVSYTDWTTANFDEVTVPTISGYTATQSKVAAQKVDGESSDVVIKVTYKKNPISENPDQPINPDTPVTPDQPATPTQPEQPTAPETTTETEDLVVDKDHDHGSKDNDKGESDEKGGKTEQVEHLKNLTKKKSDYQNVKQLSTKSVMKAKAQAKNKLPQTGEKNGSAINLALAGISLVALAGLLFFRKKN